jgi:hypothetical protein
MRPSTLTIYGEAGRSSFRGIPDSDGRGGVAIEFEFIYPDEDQE